MANPSLVDWALENATKLNLAATRVSWVDEWLPGHFDYQVSITVDGVAHVGRGIDQSEETAFAKSLSEALERAAVSGLNNPWATAAYPDLSGAEERAYYELLGIDRVICHHYCHRPARRLSSSSAGSSFPGAALTRMLRRHKLELVLLEFTPALDARITGAFVFSTVADKAIKGFIKGYGVAKTVGDAVANAIVECMRNVTAVFLGGAKPEPQELLCRPTNPRWHFWQAQSAESLAYFRRHFLARSTEQTLEPESISKKDASFLGIYHMENYFHDIPLSFVQASSCKLLKPQFGEFRFNPSTLRRLETFNEGQLAGHPSVPHFYG